MRDKILLNISDPQQLEQLYRTNKPGFKSAFNDVYPQLGNNPLADGWYQRLNYRYEELLWGTPNERLFVIGASLLAGLLAQLPKLLALAPESFYAHNVGFIVFPILIAYFAWKNTLRRQTIVWLSGGLLLATVFINTLPKGTPGDTLILSCIHLPLWLWSLLGFTFGGGKVGKGANWMGFLRYNGDLVVITALLLLAGGITTGLTLGLFELIGWHIKEFYFNYIVICGLAAVPIVGTFLTQTQPTLVGKVSPMIAKLFSPVALVMLVVYLGAIAFSGKSLYHDREFLMLFNALLLGVMALIFFSVAETVSSSQHRTQVLVLFLLSAVTLVVNGIALSAVLFRIAEWGLTPNRAAVLGANVLMLIHLLYVGLKLFGVLTRKNELSLVGQSLVVFLPVYSVWSGIVTFLFPLIFGFR